MNTHSNIAAPSTAGRDQRIGNCVVAVFRAPVAYGGVSNDAFALGERIVMHLPATSILSTLLPAYLASPTRMYGYRLSFGASNARA
ncbi:hypothetical protein V1294_005627 [Bradyrhizobium sp. AZCC 1678]|uniref:hypothetical protein n=1 Tax=Bradyrhizobium sp. AZCC 1678 TaxID=3117030 RepID=UPI002FF1F46C